MNVLLKNAHVYSADAKGRLDIRISRSRIESIGCGLRARRREHVVDLAGHTVLPGFINGHDHLSLDLFPRRGRPPYRNFYEWARDAYLPFDPVQQEIMTVSLRDRLLWGGYRNLAAGCTTVVHHDPFVHTVFRIRFPVHVLQRYVWAHSLGYGRRIGWKGRWARVRRRPFVIHAAEGIDKAAAGEIDRLHQMRLLGPNTVLVHAVALSAGQLDLVSGTGAAIVTCPSSSRFLYGATASIRALRTRGIPVALGTDSTLSGSPTLLHEIRNAFNVGDTPADILFEMVTSVPARVFRLSEGRGSICEGGRADLVAFPSSSTRPFEDPLHADPVLVLNGGAVRLVTDDFAPYLSCGEPRDRINGRSIWMTGNFQNLRKRIARIVRRDVLHQNPFWQYVDARIAPLQPVVS